MVIKMNLLEKTKVFLNKNKWLVIFLLLIPSFYPDTKFLRDYFIYHLIYGIMMCPIAVYLFLDTFFFNPKKPSYLFLAFIIYNIYMVIDQVKVWWLDYKYYTELVRAVNLVLIIEKYRRDNELDLLNALMLQFEVLMYPNLISIIINRLNGITVGETLLGYYNNIIVLSLPAICVAVVYLNKTNKRIRSFILIAIAIISCLISGSATPIMAMVGFIGSFVLLYLLLKVLHIKKIWVWPLLILAIVVDIFFVLIYREGLIPVLDSFFLNVLHRSPNLTGRVTIWDKALVMINEGLKFGHGYAPVINMGTWNALHSHNEYLNILTKYGLAGLGMYSVFTFIYAFKVEKMKNNLYKATFISLFFAIQIAFITDAIYRAYLYYIVFFLAYYFQNDNEEEVFYVDRIKKWFKAKKNKKEVERGSN